MDTKGNGRGFGGDRKGAPGGKDRHDDRRKAEDAPKGRVDEVKVVVERGVGVNVVKVSKVDRGSFRTLSVGYRVEFDGHPAIECARLGEARDRAKQPAPEIAGSVTGNEAAAA